MTAPSTYARTSQMTLTPGGAAGLLWSRSAGLPEKTLKKLHFKGDSEKAVNSSFLLGTAAQASIGLSGLSVAQFHELRGGPEQDVTVDARHAVIAFHSEAFYTTDIPVPKTLWDSIAGLYKTKDNSYVRIHTNFPHHRRGILDILNIPDTNNVTAAEVQEALSKRDSVEFETEAANRGMCATALRSFEQWGQHPHSEYFSGQILPVEIRKIGDAPKRAMSLGKRPLEGIRVLDLTRVLAGPVCGRTLAAHGADVLLITSPNLPSLPNIDIETSLGKRTTQIDLQEQSGKDKIRDLAKDADVFLQAYRPGGLDAKGFGIDELAKSRPGIVCANLRAWGWDGPWKERRGFDSLVQTATGFNHAEGKAYQEFQGDTNAGIKPRPFPVQAIDHAAGYLLAFGINAALCKTITEGGSWEVRVSLAGVGRWIRSLGRNSDGFVIGRPLPSAGNEELEHISVTWKGIQEDQKWIKTLRHPAVLSLTPVREGEEDGKAPLRLDAHEPTWLEK